MNADDSQLLDAPAMLVDMHSDIPFAVAVSQARGQRESLVNYHLPQLRAGGVTVGVWALGGDYWSPSALPARDAMSAALAIHDALTAEAAHLPASLHFETVTTVSAMRKATDSGRIAYFLTVEGTKALSDDVSNLQLFFDRGVRMLGLVHNRANSVAGSSGDEVGLSPFGRTVVLEATSMGMIVDIAHLSERAALAVIDLAPGAVFCSHSNAKQVCPHQRNLSNQLIDALGEAGGVVGVNFYPHYIDHDVPSLARLIDHIEYLGGRIGIDKVGIGADFVDYREDTQFPEYPDSLKNAGELCRLAPALLDRGFLPIDISGILGNNFITLASRVLDRESI